MVFFFSFLFSTNCCILKLLISYIFIYKWMKRLLYDHILTLFIHYVQVGGWRGGVDWWAWYNWSSWYIVLPLSGTASFAGRTLMSNFNLRIFLLFFILFIYYFFFCSLLFLIVSFFFLSLISHLLCYTPATIDCFFSLYSLALPFTSHLKWLPRWGFKNIYLSIVLFFSELNNYLL